MDEHADFPLSSPLASCQPKGTTPVERGATQCTAHSKRTKLRCQAPAMIGRTVCYHHGGPSLVGIANPAFKTGRHSKYLPKPLMERHEERLANIQQVKKLDEELVILDNRISDLLSRLQTGERGTVWDDFQYTLQELHAAQDAGEPIADHIAKLDAIATAGKETEQAYRDIDAAIHSKAKVSAIEAKRAADAGEVATKDEVKTLVLQIVNVVRDHVTDPHQLRLISNDLTHVLQGPNKGQQSRQPVPLTANATPG